MGLMAKHTDPIVGMDMHMVQPPPPAPPVMVPHPVVGMVMDPADYQKGACTVFVNGLARARAGTLCMLSPPHIPMGGVFVMPVKSEAEMYQGSSTVTADGDAVSAMGHQVLGCHDVGAPAPSRAWKSGGNTSLMDAGSVVLPIPGGPIVNVGGAPTTSAEGASSGFFIDLELIDPDGTPFANHPYEVHCGDGKIITGTLDGNGKRRVYGIQAEGSCDVIFPKQSSRIRYK